MKNFRRSNSGMGLLSMLAIMAAIVPAILALSQMFKTSNLLTKRVHDDAASAFLSADLLTMINHRELCTQAITTAYPLGSLPKVDTDSLGGVGIPAPALFKLPSGEVFSAGFSKYSVQIQSMNFTSIKAPGAITTAYGGSYLPFEATVSITYQRLGTSDTLLGNDTKTEDYSLTLLADPATQDLAGCFSGFTPEAQCANAHGTFNAAASPKCQLETLVISKNYDVQNNLPPLGAVLLGKINAKASVAISGNIIKSNGAVQVKACGEDGSTCPNFEPWITDCTSVAAAGPILTHNPTGVFTGSVQTSCPSGKIAFGYSYSTTSPQVFVDGINVLNNGGSGQVTAYYGTMAKAASPANAGLDLTVQCCATRFVPKTLDPSGTILVDW